jgi:hypothetical protein
MITKLERLCRQTLIALFVIVALSQESALAQTTVDRPAPPGMKACDFEAQSGDGGEPGLAIREAPSAAASVLGYIPSIEDKEKGFVGANIRILGAKDGWFLIEGAGAKGWVDGRSVTTHLYRETLKAAPDNSAPDVVYLIGYDDESIAFDPQRVPVSRIVDCSGPWLEVEIRQPGVKTLSGQPASPDGIVRGWTDRSCPDNNADKKCRPHQFNYPWSPLPAGIVECSFGAFSDDRDPAGLNVRAEPDRNARILGRLPPPTGDRRHSGFLTGADVIGYKKGWFLIEGGYVEDLDPQDHPKFAPYAGRGWVAADLMSAQLLRRTIKLAPSETSTDVASLELREGDETEDCCFVRTRRILACSGDWVHVEVALTRGVKPPVKTDAPPSAVRGWANGVCTSQTTPCTLNPGAPWSPPAPLPPE